MAHEITVPAHMLYWDHTEFFGRRQSGDSQRSYWGIGYAAFASQEDAENWPRSRPVKDAPRVSIKGDLLDAYFLDGEGAYEMTDQRVALCLRKLLSEDFTQEEIADVQGDLAGWRQVMLGVPMFGLFTVSELVVTPGA